MNKERFGAFITEIRKERHLTQKDLAEKLHVTDKAVSKWERGLSYPDVTLMEPLAEALKISVSELLACQRKERRGEESVKALLEISGETVERERRHSRLWICGMAALLLAAVFTTLHRAAVVTEQRNSTIYLKESIGEEVFLYIEENGHLLKLKCGENVDFDAVTADNMIYKLDCQWNRWTYRGAVTDCEKTDIISMGGEMSQVGSGFDLDYNYAMQEALFGYRDVICEITDSYPDP